MFGFHTCQAEPAAETTVADSEATADAGLKVLGDSLLEHGQNETIGLRVGQVFCVKSLSEMESCQNMA